MKRKVSKRNFGYREVFRLPCVKGFASMRSMLAGVAETGSETAQRLERFASARSALAGLAERREGGSRRLTDEVYFAKETLIIGDDKPSLVREGLLKSICGSAAPLLFVFISAQRLEGCEKNNSSPPAAESKPNNQNRTKNKTEAGASVLFFSPLRFFNLIALRLFLQKSAYL